jgi:hypothetical protein
LHIRPLGICSRFADWGLSVFVIEGCPLPPFLACPADGLIGTWFHSCGKNSRAEPPRISRKSVRTFAKANLGQKFTVIDSASQPNPLTPPASLGVAGRNLWQAIHNDDVVDDAGGLAMLLQICAAADRVAEYAAAIARDGMTIRRGSGVREHPLLRQELAAQSFIVRSCTVTWGRRAD